MDMQTDEWIKETDTLTDKENIALQSDVKYRNLE